MLAALGNRCAKYNYRLRSGLSDKDFYNEVEAELLEMFEHMFERKRKTYLRHGALTLGKVNSTDESPAV